MSKFYGIPPLQTVTEVGAVTDQNLDLRGNNIFSGQNTFSNATFGARFNTNVPLQFSSAGNWQVSSDATDLLFARNAGSGGVGFPSHIGVMGTAPSSGVALICQPTSATVSQLFNCNLTYTGSSGSVRGLAFTAKAQGTSTAPAPQSFTIAELNSNQAGMTAATVTGFSGTAGVTSTRQITQAATITLIGVTGQIGANAQSHQNATFYKTSLLAKDPAAYTMGAGATQTNWAFRMEGDSQIHDDKLFIFGGSATSKATNSMSWVSGSSVLRTIIGGTTIWDLSSSTQTYGDGINVAVGSTTGTKIGTAVTQKLAFWNKTPIVQPSGANQAAITDSTTGTAGFTLVDVGVVFNQANINNNFASLARLVDNIRTAMVNVGIMKGAA